VGQRQFELETPEKVIVHKLMIMLLLPKRRRRSFQTAKSKDKGDQTAPCWRGASFISLKSLRRPYFLIFSGRFREKTDNPLPLHDMIHYNGIR